MNELKKQTRKVLPKPLIHPLGALLRATISATKYINWKYSITGYRNQQVLSKFYNVHQGKRCFIIGNGPSLNKMNLRPLANEITFGLNRIYLLFERIGFRTTYFVAINKLVLEQFSVEIEQLPMPKFVRWEYRQFFSRMADLMYIRTLKPSFSSDIRNGAWGGATVTYVAMQIAYYMGFRQVILIGVDHSFATTGKPHKEIISTGNDPNHFNSNYFGIGTRWHLPDLETSEFAYKLAKINFEEDNRVIMDATIGGKLEIFPKVSYEEIITTQPQTLFIR